MCIRDRVVTGATSVSYLADLREHRISYIVAGEAALDCRIAAEKLKELFGIRTLLICGGGLINGTFLQQGIPCSKMCIRDRY